MINHFLEEYPQYQIAENWQFRKAHLWEEFQSALTIFDLDD